MDAGGTIDVRARLRTVKSCGSGTSTLVSSRRKTNPQATVAKEPDRRGDHEVSRKTIAWGRRANLVNLVSEHALLFLLRARLRVRQAPGVPHAL